MKALYRDQVYGTKNINATKMLERMIVRQNIVTKAVSYYFRLRIHMLCPGLWRNGCWRCVP